MKLSRKAASFVFSCFGVLLVIGAVFWHQYCQFCSEVVKDLAVVILSVVIIDLLWNLAGGEPVLRRLEDLASQAALNVWFQRHGLVGVYPRSASYGASAWADLVNSSRSAIDLGGHTLYADITEREEVQRALRERALAGVRIRILINHPQNPSLVFAVDSEHDNLEAMRQQMESSWKELLKLRESLPQEAKPNFRIARLKKGPTLHAAMRRVDARLFVVPYLYSKRTGDSPLYLMEGAHKPLFEAYAAEFDRLFACGTTE